MKVAYKMLVWLLCALFGEALWAFVKHAWTKLK